MPKPPTVWERIVAAAIFDIGVAPKQGQIGAHFGASQQAVSQILVGKRPPHDKFVDAVRAVAGNAAAQVVIDEFGVKEQVDAE